MFRVHSTFIILLGVSSSCIAAPALQMYVFERDAIPDVTPTTNTIHVNELAHDDRYHLQMHVFNDTSSINQHNGTIAKRVKKEPFFSYQTAAFYLNTGYRRDEIDWSIAGLLSSPNILSELTWKASEVATINAGSTLYFKSNWLLNIDVVYGRIFDGKNQDSDYFGNNRTLEFSRSNNNADIGDVLDISTGIGYNWQVPLLQQQPYPALELRPQAGLSYHSQNLKIVDGFQTIPATGAFSGLDSRYDTTWFGPWVGLDSRIRFNDALSLAFNVEYHYVSYDGTANWNLRSDFAHPESFTHQAKGYGLVGSVTSQLQLEEALSLTLSVDYQDWQAHRDGIDTTYFSNGTALITKFNGVNWRSFGANIGLIYEF